MSVYDKYEINDQVIPFDYDSDGRQDLLKFRPGSGFIRVAISGSKTPPELLQSVKSSTGSVCTFYYTPSTSYLNGNIPFVIQTVSATIVDDGFANYITTQYYYDGGYYDLTDRQFRGFAHVSERVLNPPDSSLETVLKTTYYQDKYRAGLESQANIYASDGTTLLSTTTNSWDASEHLNTNPERVFLNFYSTETHIYDNGSTVNTRTDYTYDENRVHGGVRIITSYGTGNDPVITTKYYTNYGDSVWRVTTETVQDMFMQTNLRQTDYGYQNTTGNMLWKKDWLSGGSDANQPITSYSYDVYGNQTSITDPMGSTTTTAYDTVTNTYPVIVTYPDTGPSTARVHHVVQYLNYDYRYGKPTQVMDENGNITQSYFDEFGRIVEVDSPDGGQTVTIYNFDSLPREVITMVNETDYGTFTQYGYLGCLGRGMETHTFYDGLNREIRKATYADPDPNSGNVRAIFTKTFYNNLGQKYKTVGPFFVDGPIANYSELIPINSPPYTLTEFDNRGRVVKVTSPDSSYGTLVSTIVYSGLVTTTTDPEGKKKTETKDYLGHMVQVDEYGDNSQIYHTYYSINIVGDLRAITDHLGNVTRINYDTLGRKINIKDPDMGYWQYAYDNNSNLNTVIDANGDSTYYNYDSLNRITQKSYSKPFCPIVFTYDNPTILNGKGRLSSIDNSYAKIKNNSYDSIGRLLSQTKTINSNDYTTTYTYDLSGKLKTIQYPDNYILQYNYHKQTNLLSNVFVSIHRIREERLSRANQGKEIAL